MVFIYNIFMINSVNLKLLIVREHMENENLNKFFYDLEKYFYVDIDFCKKSELEKKFPKYQYVIIENYDSSDIYNENYYQKINELFPSSSIFWLIKEYSEQNIFFLKYMNNDILYYHDDYETLKITNLSNLKNKWNNYESRNFISHRSLFLDFISNKFFLNNKYLELTKKEFLVLCFLLTNRDSESIDKNRIFRFVWEIENDVDNSRVVDQILHKLKKKIDISYFENVLGKGTKII